VDQEIRAEVYDKIMDADWESMSQYHSGDLLNRVDNDVAAVSSNALNMLPDFITKGLQFLGALVIFLYYDPIMAGLALISAPVTLAVSNVLMKKMRHHNQVMRQISSEAMVFNEESFQNVQVIKSFGLTKLYSQKLRQVQSRHQKAQLDYTRFSVRTSALMSVVGTVVTVICFGWGVYRLWSGHISYGTMTLFLQMSGTLTASFSALVQMVPTAINAATAAGRIMAVTELPREDHTDDEKVARFLRENKADGVSVVAQNMDFRYEDQTQQVLQDVIFRAKPGEIVALVGPSGEGKTTMLRLILGIVHPKSGLIQIRGGTTGEELPVSASTRRLFAYVPQGNTMFSGTVAENLRMMKQDATDEELYEVLRLACAEKFIRKLPDGVNSPIHENGGGFSQGQIQRLSIARALLADVPVLLLDEATSALDMTTERQILRNIMESQRRRTCIVTTHRPSVLGICNRVYRIAGGSMTKVTEEEVRQLMMDF
jgi:ABC-type multidrug transport system fused ATPase/permease subunit